MSCDIFYLTDNILIQNEKYYYENNQGDKKLIKNNNWHHLLKDYGWEKLNKNWIMKLNKLSDKKTKNSLYGCLDCGGNGDCMFSCISYAVNSNNFTNQIYDSQKLRFKLSEYITPHIFNEIIEIYKISKLYGEFNEDWEPELITIQDFKEIIKVGGNSYWGDFLLLNLLKDLLNVNFIVLNSDDETKQYCNYPLFYDYNKNIKTIILLYENKCHFKLIGNYKDNTMNSLFTNETIPPEILKLINYLR